MVLVYATESTCTTSASIIGKILFLSVGSDSPDAKRQKSSGSPGFSSLSKVCLLTSAYIHLRVSISLGEFYSHNFVIANTKCVVSSMISFVMVDVMVDVRCGSLMADVRCGSLSGYNC